MKHLFLGTMKIIIKTSVEQSVSNVWEQFDRNLLLKLSPPFPKIQIITFGRNFGDKVTIEMKIFFIKLLWISKITEIVDLPTQKYFIDEGEKLPFFLKYWKHQHIIEESENQTTIVDKIEFNTGTILTDYIFYPILYLQFIYRKPIYRNYFKIAPN